MTRNVACLFLLGTVTLFPATLFAAGNKGRLEIVVVDKETSQPIAARMHLKDAKDKPVRPPKVPYWHDHFVFDGRIELELPLGQYTFQIERGPECREQSGHFVLERNAHDSKTVVMSRFVNMRKEGWWSGDLHIHRPLEEMPLLMEAEDLHVGPVISWWNDRNLWQKSKPPERLLSEVGDQRFFHAMAGEDEREGGALLYFGLESPLPIEGSKREYPSPVRFLRAAKQLPGCHVDVEKPFWWDVPTWVATGLVDSIGLANNHMQRDGMLANEAWGKPRDTTFFPNPHGNGRWSQAIYYHLLNCGLRIAPSAGSASGVLPNPVGYNRVYVHLDGPFSWERWWEGLRAGRVVVTNGPMLRPRVNGELPGHEFRADEGQTVELQIGLDLAMREKVDYLEVVKDGEVLHNVRLDDWAKQNGQLPIVKFDRSGWMMVRAVTNNTKTYRFACSGPYYVSIAGQPRISRRSAQFFCDWLVERARRIKLDPGPEREEVIGPHREARDFWNGVLEAANSD
jgi:hypothetical protein